MADMWQKAKTALIVLLLSCLIWVFAERSVTSDANVELDIKLAELNDELMVEFLDDSGLALALLQQKVTLTVEGPTGRIQRIKEDYVDVVLLDVQKLGYIPQNEPSQDYQVRVMSLFTEGLNSRDPKQGSLRVVAADPESFSVRVTKLIARNIPVKVYDRNDLELKPEKLEPAEVEAYVQAGEPAEAKVTLSPDQQRQAAQNEIPVNAHVTLPNRTKSYQVILKLPEEGNIQTKPIRNPRLGIFNPADMEGLYKVVIEDESQLEAYSPIECQGSPEALDIYSKSDKHLLLNIYETDIDAPSGQLTRPLEYFIPSGCQITITNKIKEPILFRLEKIGQ